MNILITTFGTRGDIQPYIALGKGLQSAGFGVGICTPEGYQSSVEEHGLNYVFMDNTLLSLTHKILGKADGLRDILSTMSQMVPAIRRSMDDEWRAAQTFQPDLIVYHPKCMGSYHVAEKLQIPAIMSLPLPFFTPTSEFPVPFFSNIPLGKWFNRFSYRFMAFPNVMYGGTINDFRVKTLGLPPFGHFANSLERSDGSPVPILYPYSPHVLPVPEDFPPHVHVTGYWFLDHIDDWRPQQELLDFLEAGSPPVYIGFGSMGAKNGQKRTRTIVDALRKSGQRGLLASGWGGLKTADLPQNIFMVEAVPHDWLFPRVRAVVHHGGAGTTAAGLRAGKPTVICPFIADQPFWGKQVFQLGVGPKPVPQGRLTADNLAEAITTAVNDPMMQARATALGEKIRAEDGVARAVEIISETVNSAAKMKVQG